MISKKKYNLYEFIVKLFEKPENRFTFDQLINMKYKGD